MPNSSTVKAYQAVSHHPLDQLTPSEISETSRLIRAKEPNRKWIFNSITLKEPPKALILEYLAAEEDVLKLPVIPRKSFTLLIERFSGKVYEVTTNLSVKVVEDFVEAPFGSQPTFTIEDTLVAEEVVKRDVEVQKRCAKIGIEDMDMVVSDPWVIGYEGLDPKLRGRRLMQSFMYMKMFEGDNHYAHPLDFAPIVDVTTEEIVLIEDLPVHSDFKPIRRSKITYPKALSNFDPDFAENDFLRKDVKPLQVIQPKGPSFSVKGNEVSWQKFRMRIGFNYREGLVLHNVTYQDGDKVRPLLYRASLAEMIVPYGDPRTPFHRKCAYDVGEYGLGFCTNSLKLGCDCLGTIKYFDGILSDHSGEPSIVKNAICMHEEDAGLLFKHTEYRTGRVNVARSRRLVLSFIVTVANYEYIFNWHFYQDATISFEVKATGIISTTLVVDGETPGGHGSLVIPNVNGQFHQHIYCMRLDTMFDGQKNTVSTVDIRPLEGDYGSKTNPFGQGFTATETPMTTTRDAQSDFCTETQRFWKISNESSIHSTTGKPVAWKIIPHNAHRLMAKPGSHVYGQAGFAKHAVWVTPHKDEQLYPAGFYINQTQAFNGLPQWMDSDEKVKDEDLVLWLTYGVSHVPRVEDFPIMPTEMCGFTLKPCNFFMTNPALDVPPPDRKENKSIYANAFEKNGHSENGHGCCRNEE